MSLLVCLVANDCSLLMNDTGFVDIEDGNSRRMERLEYELTHLNLASATTTAATPPTQQVPEFTESELALMDTLPRKQRILLVLVLSP